MGRLAKEDRGLPLRQAPAKFCPRQLSRTPTPTNPDAFNAKRYMGVGPLFGYMLTCPACGFIEMHEHTRVGFVEVDERATATTRPAKCLACYRVISVAGGVVLAVLPT